MIFEPCKSIKDEESLKTVSKRQNNFTKEEMSTVHFCVGFFEAESDMTTGGSREKDSTERKVKLHEVSANAKDWVW